MEGMAYWWVWHAKCISGCAYEHVLSHYLRHSKAPKETLKKTFYEANILLAIISFIVLA